MKGNELSNEGSTNYVAACPNCLASMYLDVQDLCWLCIICSYRKESQIRNMVKIITEKVWYKIFDVL